MQRVTANPEITLVCAECKKHRIPAPPGATAATRFTCRTCVERLTNEHNLEDAKKIRASLLRLHVRQRAPARIVGF